MKIQMETDTAVEELQVIIRCRELNEEAVRIQRAVMDAAAPKTCMTFYRKEKAFYFPVGEILFFETSEEGIRAHTQGEIFTVQHRLYELEELLPAYFLRVSKSTILNTREVYSITRNLTASSVVEFKNTHKKVYVSRNYYKPLKDMLDMRMHPAERQETV